MKILNTNQIRQADADTIKNEPISSIDLMERASRAFVKWFSGKFESKSQKIKIFCGLGNNGGDGLAIARMLQPLGYDLEVFVVGYSSRKTENFDINLQRLERQLTIEFIDNEKYIFQVNNDDLIIDAIFGSGLSRPTDGLIKSIVEKLNKCGAKIISVDMPTGLFADKPNNTEDVIVKASQTVSFQTPKLAFMLPQNAEFVGDWHIVDIGLSERFIQNAETKYFYSRANEVEKLIIPRKRFAHKGNFGHALLIAGSYGMMGAAVLSARACMRSGVGKLTVHSIPAGMQIMQSFVPEAMYWEVWGGKTDGMLITEQWDLETIKSYQAIGVGPGLGVHGKIRKSIEKLCEACEKMAVQMVLDADALNNFSIGKGRVAINKIPKGSILTPHPKEFKMLINTTWKNDFEKLDLLAQFAVNQQVIVCLKGANTAIAFPDGTIHFNSSGNAGMATAGSGDVLTGMILGLLAQGYSPENAALLGVYQHGVAGDKAAENRGMISMIASDIVDNIRF